MNVESAEFFLKNGGASIIHQHFNEVDHTISAFDGMDLDPDFDAYLSLYASNNLRVYTHRAPNNELLAYLVFFVTPNTKYKTRLTAYQDLFFVRPDHRGIGHKLLRFAEEDLKEMGVSLVFQNTKVKAELYFGTSLKKSGYDLHEEVWVKRIDLTHGDST